MSSDAAAVLQLLANLPDGENPYDALREFAWNRVAPPVSPTFEGQLIAIEIIFFLCLIFVVGSLVVRLVQKTFWIVHFGDTPRLWRPHFSVSWSMWAVVLLIFVEVVVAGTIKHYRHVEIQHDFAAWRLFAWLPAWYGGFTAAWGITVSYLLHLHAYGRAGLVERLAPWINAGALAIPTLFYLVFIPPAAVASRHFDRAMDSFATIDALLQARAKAFNGDFDLAEIATTGLPLLQELEGRTDVFLRWFRLSFGIYAAFGFFLTLLLSSVATLYLVSLRRILRVTSSWGAGSGTTHRAQQRVMRQTYANMAITICAFSLLGLTFSGTSLAMAATPHGFSQSVPAQAFTLVPLYAFALLGLPTAILLFIRSFDRSSASGSRQASHVSISVNVVSFADGPLPPPASAKKRSSSIPYLSARRALALPIPPIPEGFELVASPERDKPAAASEDSCGSALHVFPSLEAHVSHEPDLGGYTFPPPPAPAAAQQNRLSVLSIPDSLLADRESPTTAHVYSFAFGATSHLSLADCGSGGAPPLTPASGPPPRTPGAESMVDAKYWSG